MPSLEAKLVPWGASFGLRIRKRDVERLGLQPGQTLKINLADFTQPKDLTGLPAWSMGDLDHDAGFEEL